MHLEFSETEMVLLRELLDRELHSMAFERHHAFSRDYKHFLDDRERHVNEMREKVDQYVYGAEEPSHEKWATMT